MDTSEPRSTIPKAFISYSWDDDTHMKWVKHLATRLRKDGVDVTLDRWHAAPGDQVPAFMERAVRENDFVIAVCTPRFQEKSDGRAGGVGYEGDIMTAYAFAGGLTKKFIPVLRHGSWQESAPTWLLGRVQVDLSGDPYSEPQYEELLRTLLGAREQAPPIGTPRNFGADRESQASPIPGPVTPRAESSTLEHQSSVTPVQYYYKQSSRPSSASKKNRNRVAMLNRVRRIWIKDIFQKSLFNEIYLVLSLNEKPDAVLRPMDLLAQRPDQLERPLPSGTQVLDVYNEMNKALLILGEPGSGKTTLLLELCRDLLDRAEHDPTEPMPVVFPLSTWTELRQPLSKWLVNELQLHYDVSPRIGQSWVDNSQILPLLDGLDEVNEKDRNACVEAINVYRKSHGLYPLVICSRTTEYQELIVKLRLHGSIVLQPLKAFQVHSYLDSVGLAASRLRDAIRKDATLRELVNTPLMLGIVTIAFSDWQHEIVEPQLEPSDFRDKIFALYIEKMFIRRKLKCHYSMNKTVEWLAWLARQMAHANQTVFYIEHMNFSCIH